MIDDLPLGCHLVFNNGDRKTFYYRITPEFAPLIAAGLYAEDTLSNAIMEATDLRPNKTPLTPGQIAAWENLSKEFGDQIHALAWPSAREASDQAIKVLIAEAEKLMYNPTIRKAYDNFMLTVKLSYQEDKNDHN